MAIFPVHGISGREYHYTLVDPTNVDPRGLGGAGANFLFVRWISPTQHEIVFAGETPSLYATLISTTLWATAQQRYGVTRLYARPNGREDGRKRERDDLVEAYEPPMNAAS
jgi:hypothetical protein